MERNTWTRPLRATTSLLGQRNSPFIPPTLLAHTNLSPVTWTSPWCQLSVRHQRPDTNPCCLWRATNRGLSPLTAGTARFTALRSSPSLDTCGSPPYQVGYFPQSPAFTGQSCLTCNWVTTQQTGRTLSRMGGVCNVSCCVNLQNKQHYSRL